MSWPFVGPTVEPQQPAKAIGRVRAGQNRCLGTRIYISKIESAVHMLDSYDYQLWFMHASHLRWFFFQQYTLLSRARSLVTLLMGAAAPIAGKPHSGLIGDKALLGETSLSATILGYVGDA